MIKSDVIIAVNDVRASSSWYQAIMSLKSNHGGDTFEVLTNDKYDVVLCLHKWGEHDHPTMLMPTKPGNGLILYFRVNNFEEIVQNAIKLNSNTTPIKLNPNSNRREFSLYDPDGYYLIISEYHDYQG
jgi:catechol-2,3-dioxygenase